MDKQTKEIRASKVTEKFLAFLGGIFGIISGAITIVIGSMQVSWGGTENVIIPGLLTVGFAIVATIVAFSTVTRPKTAGWLLLISALGGLICVSFFYVLPFVLLSIAGIMCLTKTEQD